MNYENEYQKQPEQPPVEIPLEVLSEDALKGIIESFIQHEGTDYGREEALLETKYKQILKQLQKGDAKLIFDPNTESPAILTATEWKRLQNSVKG